MSIAAFALTALLDCTESSCQLSNAAAAAAFPDAYRQAVATEALGYLGARYRFGGASRTRGIDCAGLVRLAFQAPPGALPSTAAGLFALGEPVEKPALAVGDLVFFRNTYRRGLSHVGIFIGDGQFVHASSRRHGVVVSRLDNPYFRSRFAGARRLTFAFSLSAAHSGQTIAHGGV